MPNKTQVKKRNALLVSHRESLGLSLRQYAMRVGIHVVDYCEYETLKRYPSLNHQLTLAQFTGIHEDLLFPKSRKQRELERPALLTPELAEAAYGIGLLRGDPIDVENDVATRQLAGQVSKLVKDLTGAHRVIVTQYLGLNGATEKNFEEIGKLYGLQRNRVHGIFTEAIAKLRQKVRTQLPEVAAQL